MTLTTIEKRLAVIERELEKLKSSRGTSLGKKAHPVETLDAIHGTFENDNAFQEAMRIGRKWRKAQDGIGRNGKKRAKGR